ncbi:MAG: tetratricopeptide repeat protein [Deltaproteobacteria bacterium]|nr:tetratricopeptide repeat protein [Deltaproteobacteria bacterium]
MYTKILLVFVILILSTFFYLHTQNPGTVTFIVNQQHTYVLPITLLLFIGFFAGVILAVLNSLLVDAKKALSELKHRKEKKQLALSEENYKKGIEALVKGDTTGSRELIEQAIKVKPNDSGMIISLAETFIRENKPKEALKILEGGFLNSSNSTGILIAIAKCSADSGDTFKAIKALEEVLNIDPKNPYALRKLRDFRIKDCLWNEAANLQKTILESEQDENLKRKDKKLLTGLLFETAVKYAEEGRLNEAVLKVKEVLKNDDSFMPAHLLLGDVLAVQGNITNAIKVWEKAQYRFKNAEPLILRLEDIYIKESAPDKILEKYKREIHAHPNDMNLRLLLSRLYLRLEMVDNAIEELERLQHEGEETFYPQILLGEAYLRRKQSAKAAHLFQKALGLDKEFNPPFVCSTCNYDTKTWTPRCQSCGEWNSFLMNGSLALRNLSATVVKK